MGEFGKGLYMINNKHLKNLSIIILSMVLFSSLSFADNYENITKKTADAYLKVLQDIIDKDGVSESDITELKQTDIDTAKYSEEELDKMQGLVYSELVDFDADQNPELYLVKICKVKDNPYFKFPFYIQEELWSYKSDNLKNELTAYSYNKKAYGKILSKKDKDTLFRRARINTQRYSYNKIYTFSYKDNAFVKKYIAEYLSNIGNINQDDDPGTIQNYLLRLNGKSKINKNINIGSQDAFEYRNDKLKNPIDKSFQDALTYIDGAKVTEVFEYQVIPNNFIKWNKKSIVEKLQKVEDNPQNNTEFTVEFKDFDGKILKTEKVKEGGSATAPQTPQRDGYVFDKWDKDFSNITSNLTVTAIYKKENAKKEDYMYGFLNIKDDFIGNRKSKYYLDKKHLKLLLASTDDNRAKEDIMSFHNDVWGGSCYGISVVRELYKRNVIKLNDLQDDVSILRDVKAPVNNKNVENLINYYHLAQFIDDGWNEADIENQPALLKKLVLTMQEFQKKSRFLIINFEWMQYGHINGHSIVGESIETINKNIDGRPYAYMITALDPNYNDCKTHIYIAKNMNSWVIDSGAVDASSKGFMIKSYASPENHIYINKYPEKYLRNPMRPNNTGKIHKKNALANSVIINADIEKISKIINNDTKKQYLIKNIFNEKDVIVTHDSFAPTSSRQKIILPAGNSYTVIPKNKNSKLKVTVRYKNTLSTILSTNLDKIIVRKNGDLHARGKNTKINASVVYNNNVKVLNKYKVASRARGVNSLTMLKNSKNKSVSIKSDNMKKVKVYISDEHKRQSIKASAKSTLTLKNTNGSTTVYADGKKVKTIQDDIAFIDVSKTDWFYNSVAFVYRKGLMTGVTKYKFKPHLKLTKAMVWQIFYNWDSNNEDNRSLNQSYWYDKAQNYVIEHMLSDGQMPNNKITREEVVLMLYKKAGSPKTPYINLATIFDDHKQISAECRDAIKWAKQNNIIQGKSPKILDPKGIATRAEMAKLLCNYLEKHN